MKAQDTRIIKGEEIYDLAKEEYDRTKHFERVYHPGDYDEINERIRILTQALDPKKIKETERDYLKDTYTTMWFMDICSEISDRQEQGKEQSKRAREVLKDIFEYSCSLTERYLAGRSLGISKGGIERSVEDWTDELSERLSECLINGWRWEGALYGRKAPEKVFSTAKYIEGYYHACIQAVDFYRATKNKKAKRIANWVYRNMPQIEWPCDIEENTKFIGERLGYSTPRIWLGIIFRAPIGVLYHMAKNKTQHLVEKVAGKPIFYD